MLSNMGYFTAEAWRDAKRRPVVMFLSVFSIALLLFFASAVYAGGSELQWLLSQLRQDALITVFLAEDVSVEDRELVKEQLQDSDGVTGINYIAEEKAMAQMQDVLGEHGSNLVEMVGFNPFLSYFEVGVEPEAGVDIIEAIQGFPGVESVRDNRLTLERLTQLTRVMDFAVVVTLFFVGAVMLITISHIVYLGLMAREIEMEVYRLLGAGRWFAVMPFLLQGAFLGLLGGVFSAVLAIITFPVVVGNLQASLPFLPLLGGKQLAYEISPLIIIIGFVFGLSGSILAQSQYREY